MSSTQSPEPKTLPQVFATRLKIARQMRNLSQRELAIRCGLSSNQVNRYENEVIEPSISAFQAIIRELNVSADYLLGLTPDDYRPPLSGEVDTSDQELLDTFHREGWRGVAHLSIERM